MRIAQRLVCALGLMHACACALGQEHSTATPLVQGDSVVTAPGLLRVALVFLLVAGLAVGVVVLLRRWLPKLPQGGTTGAVRVLERANVSSTLRVHTIETQGRIVVVAEGKSGIAMTVLESHRVES